MKKKENKAKKLPKCNSEELAVQWMLAEVDDPCVDNIRFAFVDDAGQMRAYKEAQNKGCCGFFDEEVLVMGRVAKVGCNFGH